MTTRSTASSAASTSARACTSCSGLPSPFKPRQGAFSLEPEDERVEGGVRLGQELEVAGVQKIETAIGEADAQAPPFGEPLVEHRPVEHDLLLGRQRSGGK